MKYNEFDEYENESKKDISILALIQQNATTALNRDNIDYNQWQKLMSLIQDIIKENKTERQIHD